MRINYNDGSPSAVPTKNLQHKGQRYYFQETIKLKRGKVYVSPFDLNIEQGKVEFPLKPVIRFATPVFDKDDNARGMIIFNYLGNKILDRFILTHTELPDHSILLNADGYWMHGASSDEEWGFMFPEKKDKSFGNTYPQAWQQIKSTDHGQFQTDNGQFIFTTVYPLKDWRSNSMVSTSYHWKIVSHVPLQTLTASSLQHATHISQLFALLISILAIASWLLARDKVRRSLAEKELAASEESLREAQRISHIGNWDYDLIKDHLLWSDEIYRIFEIDPIKHGATYEGFLSAIHPDDREEVNKAYIDSIAKRKDYAITHRLLMKDNSLKWVTEHCTTIYKEGIPIRSIGTVQDITQTVQAKETILEANKKLKELASTDSLTGAYNRRFFIQQASKEFTRFKRYGSNLAVLFIDADDFKSVNDKFGHAQGDKALTSFVSILKAELRSVDIIGRIGGDEFAVLLPETNADYAAEVANRICKHLDTLVTDRNAPFPAFTVSIGVSTPSSETDSLESLMILADKAMYIAKEKGRNQVFNLKQPDS